jgi:hypothetical protein
MVEQVYVYASPLQNGQGFNSAIIITILSLLLFIHFAHIPWDIFGYFSVLLSYIPGDIIYSEPKYRKEKTI